MDDMISRQAAIDALTKHEIELPIYAPRETDVFWDNAIDCCISEIEALPSAQPDLDEWCTDCKEYDPKRHSCPRYNKVIREALKGAEPRKPGRWNFIGDNMFECTSCGVAYTTEQLNGLRNYDTDPYAPKFCPNCGADMRGGQDG